MAQSQNKSIEFQTTGVSYLGLGGKVGKFLVGDVALEFYADANVEDYIQLPWSSIQQIGANVSLPPRTLERFSKLHGNISEMRKLSNCLP